MIPPRSIVRIAKSLALSKMSRVTVLAGADLFLGQLETHHLGGLAGIEIGQPQFALRSTVRLGKVRRREDAQKSARAIEQRGRLGGAITGDMDRDVPVIVSGIRLHVLDDDAFPANRVAAARELPLEAVEIIGDLLAESALCDDLEPVVRTVAKLDGSEVRVLQFDRGIEHFLSSGCNSLAPRRRVLNSCNRIMTSRSDARVSFAARNSSSVCLRAVMSRVIPATASTPPSVPKIGTRI